MMITPSLLCKFHAAVICYDPNNFKSFNVATTIIQRMQAGKHPRTAHDKAMMEQLFNNITLAAIPLSTPTHAIITNDEAIDEASKLGVHFCQIDNKDAALAAFSIAPDTVSTEEYKACAGAR